MLADHLQKTKKENLKEQKIQDTFIKIFNMTRVYEDFINLPRRRASDKVLRDKEFNITKEPKYDEYQCGLASRVYKISDKNSTATYSKKCAGANAPWKITSKQQKAEELLKPIIRKF